MKLLTGIGSTAILLLIAGCGAPSSGADAAAATPASADGYQLASKQESKPAEKIDAQGAVQQRYVIRNADLTVRVPNVEEAERHVTQTLNSWGGYVESSTSGDLVSERPTLEMTLRVPVSRFDLALKDFGGMGTVLAKSITGEDVTAKVVDLDARLTTMKATESSVRQLLGRARNLDEIVSLRDKLGAMRADIESLMAQRKSLGELSALSSVKLRLEQRSSMAVASGDPNWAQEAWASSSQGVANVLRGAGTMAIMAAVYVPVWGPLAFVAWYASKSRRRRTRESLLPDLPSHFQY